MAEEDHNMEQGAGDTLAGEQKTINVLLIEDNPADAYLVEIALHKLTRVPFHVTHIDNMDEADIALEKAEHDVILLDLNVGESRGWETFERVAAITLDQVPIVISTGLEDDSMALRAIQAGAQDYYIKEITKIPGILSRILRYAIQRHDDKQELRQVNETLHRRESELESALIDLKDAQLNLVEAEKMKTIGRLAAGVAHEVKNPLQIIKMGMSFIAGRLPENDMAHSVIDDINTAVDRATTIIGGLLDFGAPRTLKLQDCSLQAVLDEAFSMVRHAIHKDNLHYSCEIIDDIDIISIDQQKIVQVLVNLMINSCHAMEEHKGGSLCVRASIRPLEEIRHVSKDDQVNLTRSSNQVIVIEISDNGPGIPEDILPKLFEPFFTTKSKGKGTGMGLCVCRMIMEMHEGGLTMQNSEQGGAIARAYWPVNAS
jgi:signal transduction histidine kinase